MRNFDYETLEQFEQGLRECARVNEWRVLRFAGFVFKSYGKWHQIMQTPDGLRASGASGHKTVKAFVSEALAFVKGA